LIKLEAEGDGLERLSIDDPVTDGATDEDEVDSSSNDSLDSIATKVIKLF